MVCRIRLPGSWRRRCWKTSWWSEQILSGWALGKPLRYSPVGQVVGRVRLWYRMPLEIWWDMCVCVLHNVAVNAVICRWLHDTYIIHDTWYIYIYIHDPYVIHGTNHLLSAGTTMAWMTCSAGIQIWWRSCSRSHRWGPADCFRSYPWSRESRHQSR